MINVMPKRAYWVYKIFSSPHVCNMLHLEAAVISIHGLRLRQWNPQPNRYSISHEICTQFYSVLFCYTYSGVFVKCVDAFCFIILGCFNGTEQLYDCLLQLVFSITAQYHLIFKLFTLAFWMNTLRLWQNDCKFADDIFKCIFWRKIYKFWLKFHWSLFLINNIPALDQMMALHQPVNKLLSDPITI